MNIYEIKINQGNHFKTHKKSTYDKYKKYADRSERTAITAKVLK